MATSPRSDPLPPDRSRGVAASNATEAGAPEDFDLLELVATAEDISKRYQSQTLDRTLSRSYRAYQNQHAENSKYLGAAFKGRSRLFVPKTRAAVRKNLATAAAALFSTDDVLSIAAEYEDDDVQRAAAAVIKADVDYRLTRTSQKSGIPWFLIAMGGSLDAQLTGCTISKQFWDFEEVITGYQLAEMEVFDEAGNLVGIEQVEAPITRVTTDRPMILLIAIENVGIDPAAPWYDPIQLGAYFFCDHPMHLTDVRARMRSPDKRGRNDWLEVSDEVLIKARVDDERAGRRRAREGGADRYEEAKTPGEYDIVWIRENFFRVGGVDYHFWSVGREAFLSQVQQTHESYPELGGERPYKMGVSQLDSHRVFPMPPVESWQPLQLEANDVANLRLDTLKRSIAPLPTVKRGRNVDLTQLMRRGQPDAVLQVDSHDDVNFIQTPPPNGAAYNESSVTNALFDELAGVYSTSSVMSSRQLNETVGGMRLMAGASNSVSEFDLRVWVETWVEPVLRQIVHLVRHNESDETIMRIAGAKAQVLKKFNGIVPTEDDFANTEITLRVNVGIGAADPMQKLQKLQMALNMLAPMLPMFEKKGIKISPEDIIEEVMGGAGFRDGKRFFEFGPPPPDQPPPEIMQLMEKMKLEHEKLKVARENLLLELQADAAKTQANNDTKLQVEQMKGEASVGKQVLGIHADREARQENANHDRLMRLIDVLSSGSGNGAAVSPPAEAPAGPMGTQQDGEEGRGGYLPPATMGDPNGHGLMQPDQANGQQLMVEAVFDQLRQFAEQLRIVGEMVNHLDQKISAPVEVVRDAEGRPVAYRKAGQLQMIERGPDGTIVGATPVTRQ